MDVAHDVCKQHSGLDSEIETLKESNGKQWDCLNELTKQKASTSFVRWVIGVGLVLSMAVTAFLWGNQVSNMKDVKEGQAAILAEIKQNKAEATTERQIIQEKLETLRGSVRELERDVKQAVKESKDQRIVR